SDSQPHCGSQRFIEKLCAETECGNGLAQSELDLTCVRKRLRGHCSDEVDHDDIERDGSCVNQRRLYCGHRLLSLWRKFPTYIESGAGVGSVCSVQPKGCRIR